MELLAYAIAAVAIFVMAVNVFQAIRLRRSIVGGEIGSKWSALTGLIALFFVGYVLSPVAIYTRVPEQYLMPIVFGVFLFGAVFVWVVIGIIRDTLTFLKLVKK